MGVVRNPALRPAQWPFSPSARRVPGLGGAVRSRGLGRRAMAALALASLVPALAQAQAQARGRDRMPAGWKTDFGRHTVPLEEIVPGGPTRDGIPPIDRPRFETVREADRWLDEREPVIVVEHAGDARAYPYQILIWHEIVNDRVGDLPVAVTYCPLCNTALVFDRRHGGRVLDFGTTGWLRHSDLVMYDRQTESWWQQATGEAIVGELAGDSLRFIGAQSVSWKEFRTAQPQGRVLSRRTGYDRPYGRNPYAGYDARGGGPIPGFLRARPDDRLPAMERVVAVRLGGESVAYPFSALAGLRVVNDVVAGRAIAVWWGGGTASALDRERIADGRDVGATGVFERIMGNRTLTFEAAGEGRFRDRETGSVWDLLGRATGGPLEGARLKGVPHGDFFWFAWAAFQPATRIRRK